jgi:hypothetical protein
VRRLAGVSYPDGCSSCRLNSLTLLRFVFLYFSQANSSQPTDPEDHAGASNNADGGEGGDPFADNIFFAPAEHTESIKQRKERKRQERLQRKVDSDQQKQQRKLSGSFSQASASPAPSRGGDGRGGGYRPKGATGASFESSGSDLPDPAQLESRQGTPPGGPSLPPRGGDPRRAKSRSSGGGGRGESSQYSSAIFRDEDDYDGRRDGPAHGGGYGLGAGYRGSGSGSGHHHHHPRTSHPGKSFADYTLRECGEDIWYYARGWLFCFPAAKGAA